ncbi:MAG: hypothetical protein G01um101418_696 [Parcubacteria group bacterium Gr01-1014_18]|nr:MAG: hypothetical protein Greene041636_850 [Parcubacteria group bacterium Greene0416_36]TSC80277.1 MAG: hypothetical protein G01um101418_696 [Parcubacteria group bacterium Gr01-1014_18]TSC98256.1 MAG: hypothetical protein Greene101420_849 [Parcubacteria group bacterium Greene1014_20]TSD07001.1 MAG: hypothetical protein Greene07142_458 [Parcubacteria group bacterium Greene0714_2]
MNTLIYFDLWDYPLTGFEVWQNIGGVSPVGAGLKPAPTEGEGGFADIEKCLAESVFLREKIEYKNGFYFLRGRGEIVQTRHARYLLAFSKYRKAKRIAWILSRIPFIRAIFVSNTLAYSNAKPESDIDFFIVTSAGRIWFARFWAVMILSILRLRPRPNHTRDTICLSFWVSEQKLNLESLTLGEGDIYFYYWLVQLVALYDDVGIEQKLERENAWLKKYLPNAHFYSSHPKRRISGNMRVKRIAEWMLRGRLGDRLTLWTEKIQRRKMNPEITAKMNKGTDVVINADILKMHVLDRREEIKKNYELKQQIPPQPSL